MGTFYHFFWKSIGAKHKFLMTSGLTVLMFRWHFVRLVERFKRLPFHFIGFLIFIGLFLTGFFLSFWVHIEHVVLVEILIIHQLGGVCFWVEMTSVHLLPLSDYEYFYSSYRVLGVSWKYYWLTPLFVIMCDCFLRKEAGEAGEPNSSDFFIKIKTSAIPII
jgi:hypothetical protein